MTIPQQPENMYTGKTLYYPPEYFSGCDIRLEISNWLELGLPSGADLDIQYLTYKVESSAVPLYNYNTPVATKIVVGNRLVTGVFAIVVSSSKNFIDKLYGRDSLKRINNRSFSSYLAPSDSSTPLEMYQESISNAESYSESVSAGADNYIWNNKGINSTNPIVAMTYPNIKASIESGAEFDITISYGENNIWAEAYGANLRTDTIQGCVLTGVSVTMKHDSQPIADIYTFQAKDVIRGTRSSAFSTSRVFTGINV